MSRVIFISNETKNHFVEEINEEIAKASISFKIETALIRAIIKKESQGFVFAFRVDHRVLKKQKWYRDTLSFEEQKDKIFWASYGLMQVLYGNAKHNGFKGRPEGLMNIETNIRHGCYMIRQYKRYYKNIKHTIAAYNGGYYAVSKKKKTGKYSNAQYVNQVYKYYKRFGGVK